MGALREHAVTQGALIYVLMVAMQKLGEPVWLDEATPMTE